MTKRSLTVPSLASLAVLASLSFAASNAGAQSALIGGQATLGTGLEAGDPGDGKTAFRRARTRLAAGFDLRNDEDPMHGLGFIGFAEIEPHTAFGGELRYMRWLGRRFTGFGGLTGTLAPHLLIGAVVGVQWHIPITHGTTLFIEPTFSALPFGTDLPQDRVLLWGLLAVGMRTDILASDASKGEK